MTETLILAALILLLVMCAVEFVHFRGTNRRLRRAIRRVGANAKGDQG